MNMRDFSWNYFALTGDVESFMLYREMDGRREAGELLYDEEEDDELSEAAGSGI